MTSSYANAPRYAAAGQRPSARTVDRSLPVAIPEERPERVGWIVAVPMAAFAAGMVAGALLAAGIIRTTLR